MFDEVNLAIAWLRARVSMLRSEASDERGASAVEWLLIVIAVVGIAGIAIAAVRAFVTRHAAVLNG